ncbi:MAG: 4'-phosphopantetheinyl transferase superfamily protein [Spongiibacter sp.]|uniref:Enterobactin synthase component D n=1 Tax=Spongiibacter thalassae TaxID=2721624 RepID=A0ABX1GJF5_9GAMM|nr:4'-phosphopantetheinyl transferase superfamily protein [Spongiibacter thalassae]MDX1505312.1 4'-phosphopantetheinyl transferase superfamily protein [Spongiibacter sp.]NKI18528.1 4'-phosphopantetheinyl transferase superfamily protein [Spongiibacter thalassae]
MEIGRFLQTVGLDELSPPAPLAILGARFALSRFDKKLFADYGIYQPDNISQAVEKRQAEYFAGRYLAARAFARFGLDNVTLRSNNKRGPVWPKGFVGSISHTDDFACCALARAEHYLALGIDAQAWISEESAPRLSRRILSPGEKTLLTESDVPLAEGLSLVFSAKESIYKAFHPHVQRFFGYREAELTALDCTTRQLHFTLSHQLQRHPACPHTVKVDYCLLDDGVLTAVMLRR